MKQKKTYIASSIFLSISVLVNGEGKRIRFEGGVTQPYRKNGTFTTSNEEIQEALESSEAYGKQFYLVKESENKDVDQKGKGEDVKQEELEKIEGINSFRSAQSWLIENKGLTLDDVKNKVLLKEKCEELDVSFSDYEL